MKLPLEFFFLIFSGTSLQNFQNLCSMEHNLKGKKKNVYPLKPKLLKLQPNIFCLNPLIWPKHLLMHHLIYFPPPLANFIMFWIDSTFPTAFPIFLQSPWPPPQPILKSQDPSPHPFKYCPAPESQLNLTTLNQQSLKDLLLCL